MYVTTLVGAGRLALVIVPGRSLSILAGGDGIAGVGGDRHATEAIEEVIVTGADQATGRDTVLVNVTLTETICIAHKKTRQEPALHHHRVNSVHNRKPQ